MKKFLGLLILPIVMTVSSHASAYIVAFGETHYKVTLINDSYNNIVASNPSAFLENPWWENKSPFTGDSSFLVAFATTAAKNGIPNAEYAFDVLIIPEYNCFWEEGCAHVGAWYPYTSYLDGPGVWFSVNGLNQISNYAFAVDVPEPSIFVLLALGLVGLGVSRQVRKEA